MTSFSEAQHLADLQLTELEKWRDENSKLGLYTSVQTQKMNRRFLTSVLESYVPNP